MAEEVIEVKFDGSGGGSGGSGDNYSDRVLKSAQSRLEQMQFNKAATRQFNLLAYGNVNSPEDDAREKAEKKQTNATNYAAVAGPAGAVLDVIQKSLDAVSRLAATGARYDPGIATAAALANVGQVQGDIRRSSLLSDELSGFVTQTGRFSQAGQDLLAELLKPLIPLANRFFELAANTIENITPYIVEFERRLFEGLNAMVEAIETALNHIPGIEVHLGRIVMNTDPAKPKEVDFLNQLLNARAPAFNRPKDGAGAARQPMGVRNGKNVDQAIGFPAFKVG